MQQHTLLVVDGKKAKNRTMLDTIITLPDGSQGTLNDFYDGIMDESVKTTDAGYVLSDGTVLSTNGEPMWNPSAEYLYQLMSPYIDGGKGRRMTLQGVDNVESNEDVESNEGVDAVDGDLTPKKPFYKKPIGVIAIGLLAYLIYTKNK